MSQQSDEADRKLGRSVADLLGLRRGDIYEIRTPKTRTDQVLIVKVQEDEK